MIEEGLERLAAFLADAGRPAAIIGGIAIIARVGTRATRDVDVLMSAVRTDVEHLTKIARDHGFDFDPNDADLIDEGLMRMFPAEDGPNAFGADIIFADVPYLTRVIERATPVTLGSVTLPVASVEDLVVLKLEANRPLDIEDVLSIKDVCPNLDLALVRREAEVLGLVERVDLYFESDPSRDG